MTLNFQLREMTEEDKSFVYNSFLKSFHKNYPVKFVPPTLYFKSQSDIITYLFNNAKVLIACFPEDPSEIMSYCIYQYVSETLVVHYIYTKNLFRRKHIASKIIEVLTSGHPLIIATHFTDNLQDLKHKFKDIKIVYDPFLINNLRNNGNK